MTTDRIPRGLRLPIPLPSDLSLMDLLPYLTGAVVGIFEGVLFFFLLPSLSFLRLPWTEAPASPNLPTPKPIRISVALSPIIDLVCSPGFTRKVMAEDEGVDEEASPIPALRFEKALDDGEDTESHLSTETSTWEDSSVGSDFHGTAYSRAKARAKVLRKRVGASFQAFFHPVKKSTQVLE